MINRIKKKGQANTLTLFVLTILLIMLILMFFLTSFLVRVYVRKASVEQSKSIADEVVQKDLFWLFMKQPLEIEVNNINIDINVYEALILLSSSSSMERKLEQKARSFFSDYGYNCFLIIINNTEIKNCNFKSSKLQEIEVPSEGKLMVKFGLK